MAKSKKNVKYTKNIKSKNYTKNTKNTKSKKYRKSKKKNSKKRKNMKMKNKLKKIKGGAEPLQDIELNKFIEYLQSYFTPEYFEKKKVSLLQNRNLYNGPKDEIITLELFLGMYLDDFSEDFFNKDNIVKTYLEKKQALLEQEEVIKTRRGAVSGPSGGYDCSDIKKNLVNELITYIENDNIPNDIFPGNGLIARLQWCYNDEEKNQKNLKDILIKLIENLNKEIINEPINLLTFILSFTFTYGIETTHIEGTEPRPKNIIDSIKEVLIAKPETFTKIIKDKENFNKLFNNIIERVLNNSYLQKKELGKTFLTPSDKMIFLPSERSIKSKIKERAARVEYQIPNLKVVNEEIVKYMSYKLLEILKDKGIYEIYEIINSCFLSDSSKVILDLRSKLNAYFIVNII